MDLGGGRWDSALNEIARPWRVLVLSAGFGNELLRGTVQRVVEDLGFEVSVYDQPGYPINSLSHSHAACIEAISQHDIVIALLDEKEGAQFQVENIPEGMRSRLIEQGVIAREYDNVPLPTILQVEVLTARAAGKLVICLVPEAVDTLCHGVLKQMLAILNLATPRHEEVPDAEDLVSRKAWGELHLHYIVPTEGIDFGQIAFLERMRRETPNYISFFDRRRPQDLEAHITSRLAALPLTIAQSNLERADSRLLRKRTPVAASESLAWLRDHGLIISGPYQTDRGAGVENLPLLSDGQSVRLPKYLEVGTSVALLGDPGMGKSTYLLLAVADLLRRSQDPKPTVLFASWRELPGFAQRSDADELLRILIGLSAGRSAWPRRLPLPAVHWHVVLDGIDESDVDVSSFRPMLRGLREMGTLLVSCREYEFDRRLYSIQEFFETIIRLLPWGREEVDQYRTVLAAQGDKSTVEYIDLHRDDYRGVISVPLWLTMITFLNRRSRSVSTIGESSDYALLYQCGLAVAEDELRRNDDDEIEHIEVLRRAWERAAWNISFSRRHGELLREDTLREALGVAGDRVWNACRSLLDERGGTVSGFVHEIFLEYWLAEYIVLAMMPEESASDELAQALSVQRSVTTNRLIRQGVIYSGRIKEASAALREAFWQLDNDQIFAKNQILYLLGRIDDSPATVRFLVSVWNNGTEPDFVRYSAAYAGVILGVHSVEEEFYIALVEDLAFDRMNRWYHRYYYGDLQADEGASTGLDDDTGPADRAIEQIVRRLSRRRSRHLNLRRVELFTLRKFIQTRGRAHCPSELSDRLNEIEEEVAAMTERPSYARGVTREIALLRSVCSDGD